MESFTDTQIENFTYEVSYTDEEYGRGFVIVSEKQDSVVYFQIRDNEIIKQDWNDTVFVWTESQKGRIYEQALIQVESSSESYEEAKSLKETYEFIDANFYTGIY